MIFFNKGNILNARFVNNEKTDIQVNYRQADGSEAISYVQVNAEQEDFIELLKIFNLEQIEENTKKWIESQNQAVIEFHKKLIESGQVTLQVQVPNENEDTFIRLVKLLFNFDNTNEQHIEYLFRFKLELFEIEKIQNSSDEVKESIRQANTPLDLILLVKSVLEN